MAYKKIVVNDEVLIDLSNDTVEPESLHMGKTAHKANGEEITGTAKTYDQGYSAAMEMTSTATALAENIHNGKTAWVNGEEITGTAKTYEEGAELANRTLYGIYVLDRTKIETNQSLLEAFSMDTSSWDMYANLCRNDNAEGNGELGYGKHKINEFNYTTENGSINLYTNSENTDWGMPFDEHLTFSATGAYYSYLEYNYEFDQIDRHDGYLPDNYYLIIMFTKPVTVSNSVYNLFKYCSNNELIYNSDFAEPQVTG